DRRPRLSGQAGRLSSTGLQLVRITSASARPQDDSRLRAMIRVCLAGATGWVGRPLAAAIEESSDLDLVAAVSRRASGNALMHTSVEEALGTPSDVFVDYTSAAAVKSNVLLAIKAGRHVVIGSSGL